jgi:hypothetical protein
MEPYSPDFRRALKEAHPGLSDGDIDQLQELTTRRAGMQPGRDAETILRFDQQIDELLRKRLPRFQEVVREHAANLHADASVRASPKVEIRRKREP